MIEFAGGVLEPTRWRVFENLVTLASIGSSNDLAREVIDVYFQEEQSLPGTLFVAEEQPGARGRSGREWKAPRGRGIYLTFVRRVAEGEPLSVVPIAVARWTREALKEACGVAAELKWPNDLYVGRRKLAGVLAEARTQGDEAYLAVGIGINVLGRAADVGVANATTIEEETGRRVSVADLLHALIDRLDFELALPDWAREVEAWERVSLHRPGDRMKVRGEGKELTGQYLGLDPSGFLRLETSTGEAVVASGELDEW
jgi:BirA family transcriptional regulator, biotin operon repressor / biotin---[acetyl-CoA-carboxylase] ligase